jgi:hypothetical protein
MLLRARCLELAHLSFTAQVCTMAFGSKGLFTCPVQCENSGPSTFVSVVLHVITNLFREKKNRSFGPRILKGSVRFRDRCLRPARYSTRLFGPRGRVINGRADEGTESIRQTTDARVTHVSARCDLPFFCRVTRLILPGYPPTLSV